MRMLPSKPQEKSNNKRPRTQDFSLYVPANVIGRYAFLPQSYGVFFCKNTPLTQCTITCDSAMCKTHHLHIVVSQIFHNGMLSIGNSTKDVYSQPHVKASGVINIGGAGGGSGVGERGDFRGSRMYTNPPPRTDASKVVKVTPGSEVVTDLGVYNGLVNLGRRGEEGAGARGGSGGRQVLDIGFRGGSSSLQQQQIQLYLPPSSVAVPQAPLSTRFVSNTAMGQGLLWLWATDSGNTIININSLII